MLMTCLFSYLRVGIAVSVGDMYDACTYNTCVSICPYICVKFYVVSECVLNLSIYERFFKLNNLVWKLREHNFQISSRANWMGSIECYWIWTMQNQREIHACTVILNENNYLKIICLCYLSIRVYYKPYFYYHFLFFSINLGKIARKCEIMTKHKIK